MGSDSRIGGRFLRAGPAYGGSCFPKDTKGLVSVADKYKINLSVVKSVIKSNKERVNLLTQRIHKILGSNLKNKKISFLGVTFKANTDDMRESSSLKMIPYLNKRGAKIRYYDPTGKKSEFDKFKNVNSIDIDLTKVFNEFKSTVENNSSENNLALANSRSRIRMTTLYYYAGINNSIVVGTGNKVEDFGIGFYTKYGDGGVDISPIADLMKSEVCLLYTSPSPRDSWASR